MLRPPFAPAFRRYALLALPVAVMAGAALRLYRFTAEDAYIVARYAENLVRRGALEFNAGEPVNALTSPLHALVEALLFAVTGATLTAYKAIGLACFALTAGLVGARLQASRPAQAAALAVVAAPCLMLWTFGGLETPLLMLLATALTLVALRPGAAPPPRLYGVAVLAALAVLTRYDAVLFAGPIALAVLLSARDRRHAIGAAVLGATLTGVWLLFAWHTYGEVLPTSYYVKTPSTDRWRINLWYVAQNLAFTGVAPLALLALAGRTRGEGRADDARLGLYVGLAAVLLYALTAATAHMMFGFRLLGPYVPTMALVAALALARRWRGASRKQAWAVIGFAVALCVFQFVQLDVVWRRSVNGLTQGGEEPVAASAPIREGQGVEYQHEGARAYTGQFMATLARQAADVRTDWARSGAGRPLRIATFAAGILPYRLPDSYVFEPLVSERRGCDYPYSRALAADYVHVITPRHGTTAEQFPAAVVPWRLVSAYTIRFDGRPERLLVYRNPTPTVNPLPPTLHGACTPQTERARLQVAALLAGGDVAVRSAR